MAAAGGNPIISYFSELPLYSMAWSMTKSNLLMAVGSLVDDIGKNEVSIIERNCGLLTKLASIKCDFPANCIRFVPDLANNYANLVAINSDYLSIYTIDPMTNGGFSLTGSFENTHPFTCFDWNKADPRLIGVANMDSTCTVYDIELGKSVFDLGNSLKNVKTHLVAHDTSVYGIEFGKGNRGKNHFATVGEDGTCRTFDIRSMHQCTIVYEDSRRRPLMRVGWNKRDEYQLATCASESSLVILIDVRVPGKALKALRNHNGAVNGFSYSANAQSICTVGDDSRVLLWDITDVNKADCPVADYSAGGMVSQVQWSDAHPSQVGIVFDHTLEILTV